MPFFPAVPKHPLYITDIPAEPGNKDHRSYLINLSLQVEKTRQGSWRCGMLCWVLLGMLMMDAYKREKRGLVVATSQMGLNPLDSCSEGFDQLRSCAAWDLGFPSHLETCSHLAVGCAEDACRCPCETRFLLSLLLLTKGSY